MSGGQFLHIQALADGVERFVDDGLLEVFDLVLDHFGVVAQQFLRLDQVREEVGFGLADLADPAHQLAHLLDHVAVSLSV